MCRKLTVFLIISSMVSVSHADSRLMGMNIGAKNYQEPEYQQRLARLDVVILGFYPGWKMNGKRPSDVVKDIKKLNPDILVGQYTIMNETQDNRRAPPRARDLADKLTKEQWWLRNSAGERVQWTKKYNAFETNFTKWTKPDSNGDRYPEWLAKRDNQLYFSKGVWDIWYFDNNGAFPAVKTADWDLDGENEKNRDPDIVAAHRQGRLDHWTAARKLQPTIKFISNVGSALVDAPEYAGKLDGAFLEAMMGKTWSIETWGGWKKMMNRYHITVKNVKKGGITGFNVYGDIDDYRFFRYAYASVLMNDGYFSYTDKKKAYSSVPWFDEYDVNLGQAIEPPQTNPWQKGVYRRRFENGMVLVNPTGRMQTVTLEKGYRSFIGKQDPRVNNGFAVTRMELASKDGILLVREASPDNKAP